MEEAVLESQEVDEIVDKENLTTHVDIAHNHSYKILKLKKGHAQVEVTTTKLERLHENRTIYTGSLYYAANFCAVAAINDKEFFLINSDIDYLNPIDEEGLLIYDAQIYIEKKKKKVVTVSAKINDIEFLTGTFSFVKLEESSKKA